MQALEDRALLSVFVVDRLTDTGEGANLAGDFRYCLAQAADGDTITFGVEGTINLTRALPDLTHSIAIEGPGADRLTVQHYPSIFIDFRIFTVISADATISGLTIANGSAPTPGYYGGGIFVDGGTLTLTDSVVTRNTATRNGGGIYVRSGSTVITNSAITSNDAPYGGGGVFVQSGNLTIANATITNNGAGPFGGGGGLFVTDGVVALQSSIIAGNRVLGADGECLRDICYSFDSLGGGVYMSGGLLSIASSTLSSNVAIGGNGACGRAYTGTLSCIEAGSGLGGGLYMNGGSLTIENSTLSSNGAVGGYRGELSGAYGSGGNALGGGLYKSGGTLIIDESTITANGARGGLGGDYTYNGRGEGGGGFLGGIGNETHNTILAGNTVGGPGINSNPDLSGNLGSLGHNLIGNTQGGSGFDDTDLLNVDPLLGPLQDNGGPTQTMALLPGSPTLNAGDPGELGTADQRGVIRTSGVNIGAFQASATGFVLTAPDAVQAGVPFDVTVTAVDPFGQVAVGYTGTVTFSTSDPDPGVVLPADYTFTPDDGGSHTFTDTGLGETTLITPGDQALTVMDTADDTVTGSALITVASTAPGVGSHGLAGQPQPTIVPRSASQTGERPRPEAVAGDRWFASPDRWDSRLALPPMRHPRAGAAWWALDPWWAAEPLFP